MDSKINNPGDSNPIPTAMTATTSVQGPLDSNPPQTTATETTSPKVATESNLDPSHTTATTNTSVAQESTAAAGSNATHGIEPSSLQPGLSNNNDASSNRRLSGADRDLPPLPQDSGVVHEIPDRVVTQTPPPEYMSVPPAGGGGVNNTGNPSHTQRSGPGGTTGRPANYVVPLQDLTESPDYIDCPHCKTRQKTIVRQNPSGETNMAAVACCLFCGIIPAIFPYCCQWFYDVEHVCPHCVKTVARMPHDGRMEPVLPPKYQTSQFQPATGTGPAPGTAAS